MMLVARLCLLVVVGGAVHLPAQGPFPSTDATTPPQPVSGGTPEPATLLLLAGGALAYGGLRLRQRRQRSAEES